MTVACLCLSICVAQAVRDVGPRDTSAPPQGSAAIRGQVTARDTGQPLRRAMVTLSGDPAESSLKAGTETERAAARPRVFVNRTVLTNAEGTFEFDRLPAGTYRLRAAGGPYRSHWMSMAFGARRPMDLGKPIELADGQSFRADIALLRGGAIPGRVVDDLGEPVSRVRVTANLVVPGGSLETVGPGVHTDDHGRFRLFGLAAGEYAVAADARPESWQRIEGAAEGFAITYFPSALGEAAAARVRVIAGQDAGEVEIALVRTRTFKVSGTVLNSRGEPHRIPNVSLVRPGDERFGDGVSFAQDSEGRFTATHVLPGEYRLLVHPPYADQDNPPSATARRGREFASMPLTVDADIENLVVVTAPGVSVTGRVLFAEGAPAALPPKLSIVAPYGEDRSMSMGPTPSATVAGGLQFTLQELFGPCYIRPSNLPPRYVLKAVMLGGTDITDQAVEFKADETRQLQVILTSRASTLTGTVSDERGEPASEVTVVILPEDKKSWRWGSARLRFTTASEGKFRMPGVLAGTYQVLAIPRERVRPFRGDAAAAFEPFLSGATTVVVGEDETRGVELTVAKE